MNGSPPKACIFHLFSLFKKNKWGNLICPPKNSPYSLHATMDSATLKLNNQKNGRKGVCVHQKVNGEANGTSGMILSWFEFGGKQWEVMGEDISKGLKMAATLVQYPAMRGITIKRIDMHSL